MQTLAVQANLRQLMHVHRMAAQRLAGDTDRRDADLERRRATEVLDRVRHSWLDSGGGTAPEAVQAFFARSLERLETVVDGLGRHPGDADPVSGPAAMSHVAVPLLLVLKGIDASTDLLAG